MSVTLNSIDHLSQIISQVVAPSFVLGAVTGLISMLYSRVNVVVERIRAMLDARGVPVRDENGWKLSTTSAATCVMRWIDAASGSFHQRDLQDWLRSPFVFADVERPALARARAQGVRLLAWSKLSAKSTAAEAIAAAIFDARTDGHWTTTQGNAWAVLGLSEFIRRTETDRKEVKGSLFASKGNGLTDTLFHLAAKGSFFEREFSFDAAQRIALRNPGKGRIFTHVKVESRPKTLVAERKDRGYSINRSYQQIGRAHV